jgi:hypothetical protein
VALNLVAEGLELGLDPVARPPVAVAAPVAGPEAGELGDIVLEAVEADARVDEKSSEKLAL